MNTVANTIADFLKDFSPFNLLTFNELTQIAHSIQVINLEIDKTLFQINDKLHDNFYIVASGLINLSVIVDGEETILNKCHDGAIFGLRPFFAKNNYSMTAKAREETIIFAIPIATFQPFLASSTAVLNFLLENFATNTRNLSDNENIHNISASDPAFQTGLQSEMQYFQTLSYTTSPLIVSKETTAQEVAQLMAEAKSSSVLICENNFPIGIVTETIMLSKIATGRFPILTPVRIIMESQVVTVFENISLAEAQLLMIKNNTSHLCVTQDGSNKSIVKGIISERDLVVAQANNPGVLIKEIKRAQSAEELKKIRIILGDLIQTSIQKNIPLTHVANIAAEINFAIIKRAIEQSILSLGTPPARFAWLSIGSQGRKEQLLLTDQDSILIFEDVSPDNYRAVRDYFLDMAKLTVEKLEKVGYEYCSNGHMASNMLWCKSLSDWTKQYNSWMNTPGENSKDLSSIFFDYEIVYGEQIIEDAINNIVFQNAKNNASFYDFLGNDALRKNSPLTFFKKFNLEEEGPNKDKFDIKTLALMPLIDGARLFTISFDIRGINNTYVRFKQLAINDSQHSEIYLECAEAFLVLSKIRTLEGLKNDNSGQYINLDELSKIDREKLKNALAPMRDLEELIKSKFQLTQFS
jgi:CBS domain-containing protein